MSVRELPWTGVDGKRCYVIGDGDGPVSRLADDIEAAQIGLARHLLGRAERAQPQDNDLLALIAQLADAVGGALRVTEGG
ncbi:hypothetical protein QWM81_03415 [Streptomyces ficellus]|uniref:Uncharacterized protein n=1 Tax=Streptomyces ficellus TaxID=1977088 RepID=A0ABT7Z0W9_9ACTN|nr:hypothetical protein [Streptomyces ficellus]MDN3293110.1 hypothetical protein [Streptomyces ficellus]